MKKWIAAISAAVLAVTGMASAIPAATVTAADSNSKYNYGEALQKSMFFLRGAAERQKAGLERSQLAFGLHDQRLCDRRLV